MEAVEDKAMVGVGGAVAAGYSSSSWGLGTRACDSCGGEAARLYCRADGRSCAPGATRGRTAPVAPRAVWLCEVCEHAPAAVTCRADAAALCAACDADIHSANPLARRHERLPVAPFFGPLADAPQPFTFSQAAADAAAAREEDADDDRSNEAEAASWLLPEPDDNSHEDSAAAADAFFADTGAYLGVDLDFARSMDGIKAIGVPVAPPELDLTAGSLFYPEHSMAHSVSLTTTQLALVDAHGAAL